MAAVRVHAELAVTPRLTADALPAENMELELQLQRETGLFEMAIASDDWHSAVCVMKGAVRVLDATEDAAELAGLVSAQPADADGLVLEADEVYADLQDHDLKYDEALMSLRQVKFSTTGKHTATKVTTSPEQQTARSDRQSSFQRFRGSANGWAAGTASSTASSSWQPSPTASPPSSAARSAACSSPPRR